MRRFLVLIGVAVGFGLAVSPAAAATALHIQIDGAGIYAGYSDMVSDSSGATLPGTYTEVSVVAGDYVQAGDGDWAGWGTSWFTKGAACASYTRTLVYDNANGVPTVEGLLQAAGCAPFQTLETTDGLRAAHVVASVPVSHCWAADALIGECGRLLGETFTVDLVATADTGSMLHDTWGHRLSGQPATNQSTWHVAGVYRETSGLTGSITLNGEPSVEPNFVYGTMFKVTGGTVDITN